MISRRTAFIAIFVVFSFFAVGEEVVISNEQLVISNDVKGGGQDSQGGGLNSQNEGGVILNSIQNPSDEADASESVAEQNLVEKVETLPDISDGAVAEGITAETTQTPAETETEAEPAKQVEYIELPWVGMDRPEVEKFRQMYLSEKWAKLLAYYLESAMPYRIYVRKCLQEREMPDILEYLPVVESNYKTNAVSRSGAIGMWQFMANSVKPFLELNEYVDERLDPWKSTEGALRKLTDNYNIFQDWYLAIAAYNCGVGAMQKVLKKAEVKDFWYLVDNKLLPNQTALYVPKLLAIADLAINSEYYGLDLPKHDEEFELLENERNANFDYVTVNKAYSIAQIAQEMRMDEKTLKTLNPSFVMGFTHPAKESKIRLPLGMEQSCRDALEKIEPIDFPFKYKVVSGDSLWSISRRYGVTVSAICELNNIEENAILKIGKILYIPQK